MRLIHRREAVQDDHSPETIENLIRLLGYYGPSDGVINVDGFKAEKKEITPDYLLPLRTPVRPSAPRVYGPVRSFDDIWAGQPEEMPEPAAELQAEPETKPQIEPAIESIPLQESDIAVGGLSLARRIRKLRSVAAGIRNIVPRPANIQLMNALSKFEPKETDAKDTINLNDDPEAKAGRKRMLKIAGAVGFVAVAAAGTYLVSKGYYPHASSGQAREMALQSVPSKAPTPSLEAMQPIGHIRHEAAQNVAHQVLTKTKTLKETLNYHGDTIWTHVQDHVQAKYPHASRQKLTELTVKFTHQVLRLNHMSSPDAARMHVGDSFKLPGRLG